MKKIMLKNYVKHTLFVSLIGIPIVATSGQYPNTVSGSYEDPDETDIQKPSTSDVSEPDGPTTDPGTYTDPCPDQEVAAPSAAPEPDSEATPEPGTYHEPPCKPIVDPVTYADPPVQVNESNASPDLHNYHDD